MTESELKPCPNPWCGSTDVEMNCWPRGAESDWRVCCNVCGNHGPDSDTEEGARLAWNLRPDPAAVRDQALREAVEIIRHYERVVKNSQPQCERARIEAGAYNIVATEIEQLISSKEEKSEPTVEEADDPNRHYWRGRLRSASFDGFCAGWKRSRAPGSELMVEFQDWLAERAAQKDQSDDR